MKLGYQCGSWYAWCWAGWFWIVAWALSGKQRLWTNYAPFCQTQIPCSCGWSTGLLTGTKPQPDRGLPLRHSSMLTVPPIRIGRCNFWRSPFDGLPYLLSDFPWVTSAARTAHALSPPYHALWTYLFPLGMYLEIDFSPYGKSRSSSSSFHLLIPSSIVWTEQQWVVGRSILRLLPRLYSLRWTCPGSRSPWPQVIL